MEAVRAITLAAFSGVSIPISRKASTASGGNISGSARSSDGAGAPARSGEFSFSLFGCS
jgi:hypothetical protein